MMNRERERQSYQEWERKDDEFHLEQVGFRYWGRAGLSGYWGRAKCDGAPRTRTTRSMSST